MAKTPAKKSADPAKVLVAAADIFIDGKPFAAGDPIKDVDADELKRAVNCGRVISKANFDARGVPAPEFIPADDPADQPEDEAEAEAEGGAE